ncbi:two-component response regulator ARR12, putative [Medicago truncatula]|uniref:Two-component response regulator ARR12, putative n=1 Tax=Medicago truncatula TaxID=3880 RepID=G7JAS6_MEDTR|nr:two-component response regulator ARR12, putative [Medicago truncatula]
MDDSSDRFPIGMHVLVVDGDSNYLSDLETRLRTCQYHACVLCSIVLNNNYLIYLFIYGWGLRENEDKFNLVITEIQIPN